MPRRGRMQLTHVLGDNSPGTSDDLLFFFVLESIDQPCVQKRRCIASEMARHGHAKTAVDRARRSSSSEPITPLPRSLPSKNASDVLGRDRQRGANAKQGCARGQLERVVRVTVVVGSDGRMGEFPGRARTHQDMAILALEVFDEGVNVLIFLLLFFLVLALLVHRLRSLLVELAALNVGGQRRSASGRVFRHGACVVVELHSTQGSEDSQVRAVGFLFVLGANTKKSVDQSKTVDPELSCWIGHA